MARQRSSFGKLQRERERQARARAKQERRASRSDSDEEPVETSEAPVDEAKVLEALARLHAAFEEGSVSLDDFEARRDDLTSQLRVD